MKGIECVWETKLYLVDRSNLIVYRGIYTHFGGLLDNERKKIMLGINC